MRVLVTGAAGRVGANVVRKLADRGADVTAMVMPGDPQARKLEAWPSVRVVEADLGDQAAVDAACAGVTHVAHVAAQLIRGDTPVDRFYDVNAFGTLRLLEGLLHHGARPERFVLVSTDGTFRPGAPPSVPLREDGPQRPADYYGTSKLLGETILRNHADQYDVPFSIVRFATVISPEEAGSVFRLAWMRRLLELSGLGKDSHLWPLFEGWPDPPAALSAAAGDAGDDTAVGLLGPGGEPWALHMVDVRDAAEGVVRALTEPAGGDGHAFHVAGPAPTPHDEGAAILAEAYGVPKLLVELPKRWRLEMATDATRELLGFEPAHDYRGMVADGLAASLAERAAFIPARV